MHCELNRELSKLATHNFKILGAENIKTFTGDGIAFLASSKKFDWIYVDPSRRDTSGGRVFLLSDCLPNVPEHLENIFLKSNNVMIKTSPLLDLHAGLKELNSVREIHIVAVNNEVKELLWVLKNGFSGEVLVKTINFRKNEKQVFENFLGKEYPVEYSLPEKCLYEPNAAIMKSGLFSCLAEQLHLKKLHFNTHLFTSQALTSFPGKKISNYG